MKNKYDYEGPIIGCNRIRDMKIREGQTVCYTQAINNDLSLEKTEYARLKLAVRNSTTLTELKKGYEHTTIKILDDEGQSL